MVANSKEDAGRRRPNSLQTEDRFSVGLKDGVGRRHQGRSSAMSLLARKYPKALNQRVDLKMNRPGPNGD
ncbi:hypothetical protein NPIL_247361 [Nephila pilipes]|uniref:Uncharacterized protein n=1 Tax=Nephila pilipes TaxID=299642 RepID=A0A8X6QRD6_NEPPI|nr:hypothetical protein NPIL_247361 [Nephila pilipes]